MVNTAEASADPNHSADDSIITKVFEEPLRLRLVDLIQNDPVKIGDKILYRISVDNQGNEPLGPDPNNPDPKVKDVFIRTRVPPGTKLICVSGHNTLDCEQSAEGVRLVNPEKERKRVHWKVDGRLGPAGGGENSRTMWMEVEVTKKRKVIRAKAIAKEFNNKTKRKARAHTVVELD